MWLWAQQTRFHNPECIISHACTVFVVGEAFSKWVCYKAREACAIPLLSSDSPLPSFLTPVLRGVVCESPHLSRPSNVDAPELCLNPRGIVRAVSATPHCGAGCVFMCTRYTRCLESRVEVVRPQVWETKDCARFGNFT